MTFDGNLGQHSSFLDATIPSFHRPWLGSHAKENSISHGILGHHVWDQALSPLTTPLFSLSHCCSLSINQELINIFSSILWPTTSDPRALKWKFQWHATYISSPPPPPSSSFWSIFSDLNLRSLVSELITYLLPWSFSSYIQWGPNHWNLWSCRPL